MQETQGYKSTRYWLDMSEWPKVQPPEPSSSGPGPSLQVLQPVVSGALEAEPWATHL